jgi:hypothetical protein
MTDSTQSITQKSQDDIDREQMIAGIELGRTLIDAAIRNPQKIDKNEMMDQIQSLMIPQRYKDLSAKDLRQMLIDKYVEAGSRSMMMNLTKTNEYIVDIPQQHAHIAQDLSKHWVSKGFTVEGVFANMKGDENRIVQIRLTW